MTADQATNLIEMTKAMLYLTGAVGLASVFLLVVIAVRGLLR